MAQTLTGDQMKRISSVGSDISDGGEEADSHKYKVSKSRLIGLINWWHVCKTYLPQVWYALVSVLVLQLAHSIYEYRFNIKGFVESLDVVRPIVLELGWESTLLVLLVCWYLHRLEKPVYLIDFAVFQAPKNWKVSHEQLLEIMRRQNCFTEESVQFMARLLERSGTGNSTAWPPGILKCLNGQEADRSVAAAREESSIVMFDIVKKVLENTNTAPKDIDILIVNCSLFSPTPSLCTLIANEFQMRPDILSYNLSGMGCSAGVISIDLAKHLLHSRPNATALVVSTENLTQNLYHGNDRSMLLQNTLFRCGGAAIILSNKWSDGIRAQFKLLQSVRSQYISGDSVTCVYEKEDSEGHRGVSLSKDIVKVAGMAMERNLTSLGPLVLPISEQLPVLWSLILKYLRTLLKSLLSILGAAEVANKIPKVSPYIPDFKRAIDHWCIHAGGRAVIEGIEKNLRLSPQHTQASKRTLYDYGNTSSSSIWYELDYIRKWTSLRRGQRVLQIAFGSGFKCNSCVWLCLNPRRPHTDGDAENSLSQQQHELRELQENSNVVNMGAAVHVHNGSHQNGVHH